MIEILIAIILQVTTILGGGDAEKEKAEQEVKTKTENPSKGASDNAAEGGAGGWAG